MERKTFPAFSFDYQAEVAGKLTCLRRCDDCSVQFRTGNSKSARFVASQVNAPQRCMEKTAFVHSAAGKYSSMQLTFLKRAFCKAAAGENRVPELCGGKFGQTAGAQLKFCTIQNGTGKTGAKQLAGNHFYTAKTAVYE